MSFPKYQYLQNLNYEDKKLIDNARGEKPFCRFIREDIIEHYIKNNLQEREETTI